MNHHCGVYLCLDLGCTHYSVELQTICFTAYKLLEGGFGFSIRSIHPFSPSEDFRLSYQFANNLFAMDNRCSGERSTVISVIPRRAGLGQMHWFLLTDCAGKKEQHLQDNLKQQVRRDSPLLKICGP